MAYKNKEDRNAYARERRAKNPEAAQRAREISKKSYYKNLEENKRKAQQRRIDDPDRHRGYTFKAELKRYGTTVEWYKERLIEQRGLCCLCEHLNRYAGELQRLTVDHSHSCCDTHATSCGKCLRGLLCADCNILLSYLEKFLDESYTYPVPYDNSWLEKALAYLKKWAEADRELHNNLVITNIQVPQTQTQEATHG